MMKETYIWVRLFICLVASAGLHIGATLLSWQPHTAIVQTAERPLEVTLARVAVVEPTASASRSNPSRKPVSKADLSEPVRQPPRPLPKYEPVPVPGAVVKEDPDRCEPLPTQALVASMDLQSRLADTSHAPVVSDADQKPSTELATDTAVVAEHSPVSSATGVAAIVTDAEPMYWSNPLPEYPLYARRRHWEGVVWIKVDVSAEGTVLDLDVETSSGHRVLDQSAIKTVRRWKFLPAKRAGVPVSCQVRIPVEFMLEDS